MSKTFVFGAGFFGTRIAHDFNCNLVSRSELFAIPPTPSGWAANMRGWGQGVDVCNLSQLKCFINLHKPEVVINAVGATGRPNIDWCDHNKEQTLQSNVVAAINLSTVCSKQGIYFVHLSSGCIYNGYPSEGFKETDEPNFYEQFYAWTKIQAEKSLIKLPGLILRIRMPIDSVSHERNLIDKLIRYNKVIQKLNSITTMPHAIDAMQTLIERRKEGIYNLVNPGMISADNILKLYQQYVDHNYKYDIMSMEELDSIVTSPRSNCYLNTDKLKAEGLELPHISNAVIECLKARKLLFF